MCVCVFHGKEDAISFGCLLVLGSEERLKERLLSSWDWGGDVVSEGPLRVIPSYQSTGNGNLVAVYLFIGLVL